ncbi:H(+)/Cl(-) Exchange Transporter 3 [Manis pentadactyla]|nr:H(+)/Cl(-) Exchange Transporter 3 [Manis pentadactyla]
MAAAEQRREVPRSLKRLLSQGVPSRQWGGRCSSGKDVLLQIPVLPGVNTIMAVSMVKWSQEFCKSKTKPQELETEAWPLHDSLAWQVREKKDCLLGQAPIHSVSLGALHS